MPICLYCEKPFSVKSVIDGKERNLQRRKYCLECSAFGSRNTRRLVLDKKPPIEYYCSICGRCTTARKRRRCQSCNTKIRRYLAKLAAVEYLGGKCQRCGWKGLLPAYEFHHRDPSNKDFNIGNVANRKWEVILQELEKCELLCANCHRIEHSKHDQVLIAEAAKYKGRLLDIHRI